MSKPTSRFTLDIGLWYVAEIICDEFTKEGMRSYSSHSGFPFRDEG